MFILVDNLWKIVDISNTKILSKWYKSYEIDWTCDIWYIYDEKTWKAKKIETIDEQTQKIDKEIKNKILEKYSESDQANLQRAVSRILSECLFQKRNLTTEEFAVLEEAKIVDDYINQCIEDWRILKENIK